MVNRYFQLKRKNIAAVQFIIEGYGEMAAVTTMDPKAALIRVSIIPDFVSEMDGLLNYLKNKYDLKEIPGFQVR